MCSLFTPLRANCTWRGTENRGSGGWCTCTCRAGRKQEGGCYVKELFPHVSLLSSISKGRGQQTFSKRPVYVRNCEQGCFVCVCLWYHYSIVFTLRACIWCWTLNEYKVDDGIIDTKHSRELGCNLLTNCQTSSTPLNLHHRYSGGHTRDRWSHTYCISAPPEIGVADIGEVKPASTWDSWGWKFSGPHRST